MESDGDMSGNHGKRRRVEQHEGQAQFWVAWQLCDSALPTGGFAHSFGIESAVHLGIITNGRDLLGFISRIINSTIEANIAIVDSACRENGSDVVEFWVRLDRLTHASTTNHVCRRASEAAGNALLRVAAGAFPSASETLARIKSKLRADSTLHGYHAPLFGVVCRCVGMDPNTATRIFLFTTLRDCVSAGTRLNLVGPLEAAKLTRELSVMAEAILIDRAARPLSLVEFELSCLDGRDKVPLEPFACERRDAEHLPDLGVEFKTAGSPVQTVNDNKRVPEDQCISVSLWQTDPLLDIYQGFHDRLYSRLFLS
jgi:urease accessory protein